MVSIIVPVYNVEEYIKKCLDSLIHQTFEDIEILLIDDGSKDKSGAICDEYAQNDKRIRVIHKKNQGVSAARNAGIKEAKGEWILFVDSDDWINENLLEVCFKYINERTDICFFGFKELQDEHDASNKLNKELAVKTITSKDFLDFQYRIFNRDRSACCSNRIIKLSSPWKVFRKSLIIDNNLFFDEELRNGEDGVFNLYAYQYAKEGVCIEEELYYYRVRLTSVTHKYTPDVETDFRKLQEAYNCFINKFRQEKLFREVILERMIWSFSFCCILKYCHPDNPFSYRKRRYQFQKEYSFYEEAIRKVSLTNFEYKKKLIFYFIKKKNFLLISILCKMQNELEKRKYH